MDKRIVDIVGDFAQWRGDTYRLAAMVCEQQKQIDIEKLEAAEMPEAADVVR